MARASLHRFPKLPTELRLQIWNLACVPRLPNRHAVHYVDAEKDDSLLGRLEVFLRGFGEEENKSACLIDAGLWTACRESRDVMTKHWLAIQSDCSSMLAKMLVNGNGEKNGQCVVSPSRDIFCLAARDWNIDPGSSEAWQMFIKDIDVPSDISRLPNIPKTSHPKRYCRIVNIALEFDPLWVVDFPETYEDLMKEASPRGLLWRLMYYRLDGNEPAFKVWLIDRDTQWSWNPKWGINRELQPDQTIESPVDRFSDYNGDYMEANLVFRCELCTNERSGILAEFLEKVCCLGTDCKDINDNSDPGELFWATSIYDITAQARLLVRPRNQVELCNKDHSPVPPPQDSESDSDMGF